MDTKNILEQEVGKCFTKETAKNEVVRLGKNNHFYKRKFIRDFHTGIEKQAFVICKIVKHYKP